MGTLKRVIAIMLTLTATVGLFGCANTESTPIPKFFLKVEGDRITRGGETVYLRGVNAGGWLIQESWMCPTQMVDQVTLNQTLLNRFGEEKTNELLAIYRSNWWTSSDFDNIKSLGMNVIRLPFAYFNLLDENYELLPNAFKDLDWFVEEAAKRDLYVILDLHGAVGSQNGRDHSGDTSQSALYSNPDNMNATTNLWIEVARHFADCDTIAGYDLLNEPEGNYQSGTTGLKQWNYYDVLYKAIRTVDSNHIIFLESVWEADDLPPLSVYGWENVVYEFHNYCWDDIGDYDVNKEFVDNKIADLIEQNFGVPCLIGEFTCFWNDDAWEYTLRSYNSQGYHWTMWTYKVVGLDSDWGIYTADMEKVDAETMTYEEIAAIWETCDTSTSFLKNDNIANVLSDNIVATIEESEE